MLRRYFYFEPGWRWLASEATNYLRGRLHSGLHNVTGLTDMRNFLRRHLRLLVIIMLIAMFTVIIEQMIFA